MIKQHVLMDCFVMYSVVLYHCVAKNECFMGKKLPTDVNLLNICSMFLTFLFIDLFTNNFCFSLSL